MQEKEVPVYLFTGFLDAGKTSFIQETLANGEFNNGDPILLLVCEEGLVGYDPDQFASSHVSMEVIDDLANLTRDHLEGLLMANRCTRVIIEYNGMWPLAALDNAMPENWIVYQEFMFVDAASFFLYNKNMHSLVLDKLNTCELVVFNRFRAEYNKMEYHKIVRSITRRADIIYESPDGNAEIDDIIDPLPFDLDAPVVKIMDEDYAIWYQDIAEDTAKYQHKTVRVKGRVEKNPRLPKEMFIMGRRVMTCCVEDIRFAGLFCAWKNSPSLQDGQWVTVTAQISLHKNKGDGQLVPVLQVRKLEKVEPLEQEVATLF